MDDQLSEAERVLQVVAAIPPGNVSSYGRVAAMAGLPGKARFVGYVLKNLPSDSRIPWHRVVNSQGKIAFPINSEPFAKQKALLQEEGVSILNGKIEMRQYGWL